MHLGAADQLAAFRERDLYVPDQCLPWQVDGGDQCLVAAFAEFRL